MERNIPGLLVLCDNLVTLEALVYEAGCDLTLTLKELQQMKDIEKLRLLMNSVGFIFNFKHSLCTLTKVCLRTKYEMASKPEKLVITESFLIKKKKSYLWLIYRRHPELLWLFLYRDCCLFTLIPVSPLFSLLPGIFLT